MRMGREDEAQPLIDSVLKESPTDESTLQAMNIAYKELQQRKLKKYYFSVEFEFKKKRLC